MGPGRRFLITVTVGWTAFVFGGCAGCIYTQNRGDARQVATYRPLPHHVPKNQAGLAFRFAMAHDVIHERYPRHGVAFWRERERLARQKVATEESGVFAATDDLAVALHRQGRSVEAIALLSDRLDRQRRKDVQGRGLYTTYANLGTMLSESNLAAAAAGDPHAKGLFREGVEFVRKAIAVNPEAHFGRETWQAAYAEFLFAAVDDPMLLRRFDLVGDQLDFTVGELLTKRYHWDTNYGRAYDMRFMDQARWDVRPFFEEDVKPDDGTRWAELRPIRKYITKVGAEEGWDNVSVVSHGESVAFDEPALGIVGMWRQGGGADPHLALALGEIMARVGQRYLAWTAFARAEMLADRFWPDESSRQFLRDHCRGRQAEIEQSMKRGDGRLTEAVSESEIAAMRPRFEAELAHGETYQREYQEYEAAKIAAGASIDDDHFYDEFNAGRAPIASATGPEERFAVVRYGMNLEHAIGRGLSIGALCAGLAAMASAVLLRRFACD